MANILTVPESGIYFDGNTAGSSAIPALTGNASGVAIQYDGYAGITISSSATGADYQDRFSIEGENGRLFGVSDQVVGSVFSVNDAAGLPLIDVEVEQDFSKITLGQFGTDALVISGSSVQVTGSNVVTEDYLSDQSYLTSSTETYSTASELLAALLGVDGANSNLDADKLDGQQGSYYLNYNNFSNTPTIPAAANNTTITLSGGTEITTSIGDFTTNQSSPETLTINHAEVSRTNTTSTASPAFGGTFTVVDGVTSNARGHVTAENVKTITLPSLGTTSTTALAGNTTVNDVSEANLKSRLAALDSNDTIYIGDAGDDTTVVIRGTLQVDGSTTTVNSTTITVDDKNIELGSVASPSDSLADGGGITLKGSTDKTITWIDSTDSWTSNQTFSSPNLTLTSLSAQNSEATALMINDSNVVGTRELGSAAFSATSDFATASHNHALDSLSNVTITSNASGEILKWNGSAWVNNTLAEAGIASASHTHANANSTTSGFMSDSHYDKLEGIADNANNYSLPEATATVRGGIELFSDTDQSVAANTVSSTAGRTYGIQLNSAGQAVVNVPWSDTNTDTNTFRTVTAGGNTLGSAETLALTAGSNVSISESGGQVTISSTDTNTVYTHPTHAGDDISIDTGPLTGATVISDLDFNITTNTLGHVTDANGTIATRTLTPANIGAAPLASPALTGNPTAPTPSTSDNDTSIATTAFVKAQGYITDVGGKITKKISGDGTTTTFTMTHNFGTPLVMTQLLDYGDNGTGATYEVVNACIQRSSDNAIDVLFGSAPSSSEDYLVLITKMPAIS